MTLPVRMPARTSELPRRRAYGTVTGPDIAAPCTAHWQTYTPGVSNVKLQVEPLPVRIALLVNDGVPVR
jgi:hypothetical protein